MVSRSAAKKSTVARRPTRQRKKPALAVVPRETAKPDPQIEQWALARLKPYARNSRTHSKEQIGRIAKSIERFGFTNPILAAEDGTIIAGHGRVMAAKQLDLKTVPVIVASGWTPDEQKAYVIADNQLALDAGWDEEILKLELGELAEANFDLELTGFKEDDLNQLFGKVQEQLTPPTIKTQFQILVECKDEAEQLALLEELQGRAVECRALIS